jgi:hypothetical protein
MDDSLQAIIDHIADQADDFLAGAANRAEARAGVEEVITADYLSLLPADRAQVVAGVMAVLEQEGFFEADAGESAPDPE